MIEIKNLSKIFKSKNTTVTALEGIDLTINDGEIFGIIGLSGAGKSTLVRCINLLERPNSGEVIVDGRDLIKLPEKELRRVRQNIGMIFQGFNLLEQRNVIDNICFPLEIAKVKRKEALSRAKELLEIVGLSDKAKAYPSQLSGGQKQRVAIARALATNPKYLLCDEATSALDPNTTASILELLREINKNFGEIFRELFAGGHARLTIEAEDGKSPLDYGIEIEAQPPGKKLQSINLLSGGERSFTAIAILFAIIKMCPMPFCVLDEVEAALDDANIDRFAKYLRKFSEKTQFLVITHKKATMESADVLYGITMEEKGVSKNVSVQLSEAIAIGQQ